MKCPECSHNQKHKDGMKCGGCGYVFALDPKSVPFISDAKFVKIIHNASAGDTRYFTENQLYFHYCRNLSENTWQILSGIVIFIAAGLYMADEGWFSIIALIVAAVLACIGALVRNKRSIFTPDPPHIGELRSLIERWRMHEKALDKLILEPRLGAPPPPSAFKDLYDYGIERILIVERDILVDLLVLNGWHASSRTLVIAATGYPGYLMKRARACLDERPDLPVYLLHDSTLKGAGMRARLEPGSLLPVSGHPIIDLGLFPTEVQKIKSLGPCAPKSDKYRIPVDYIPYGVLAGTLVATFAGDLAFASILAGVGTQPGSSSGGGDSGFDDFG